MRTLDEDLWRRPYLIVRDKLQMKTPPTTESLHPQLEGVVSALFPDAEDDGPFPENHPPFEVALPGIPEVTREELAGALKRLRAKKAAPGPDGILGASGSWPQVPSGTASGNCIRLVWSAEDSFHMEGREAGLPPEARASCGVSLRIPSPRVLEARKLFERIISARPVEHLRSMGPDLSAHQYGFRKGRSTIDAVKRVKAISDETMTRSGVATAVSFDISNAFNTLP